MYKVDGVSKLVIRAWHRRVSSGLMDYINIEASCGFWRLDPSAHSRMEGDRRLGASAAGKTDRSTCALSHDAFDSCFPTLRLQLHGVLFAGFCDSYCAGNASYVLGFCRIDSLCRPIDGCIKLPVTFQACRSRPSPSCH
ncbi:hypothetical protein VTK56DRAFT_2934 [Thermocarpiscus australiensis]